jgi:hypothetical protein
MPCPAPIWKFIMLAGYSIKIHPQGNHQNAHGWCQYRQCIKNIIRKSKEDLKAMNNNGFKHPFFTLLSKNLRKIPQLFKR